MLVTSLSDLLAEKGRVLSVSSAAHKMAPGEGIALDDLGGKNKYHPWFTYGQSKLANILFTKELSRPFEGSGKTAFSLHPGVIKINLMRNAKGAIPALSAVFGPLIYKTTEQGDDTEYYLAIHPDAASHSGSYFADCNPAKPHKKAEDIQLAKALWEITKR